MDLYKINPKMIVEECSKVHIENVIKDLVLALRDADKLADEVLTLNVNCNEIGSGKIQNLHNWSKRFKSKLK